MAAGLDSLLAVDLANQISSQLGRRLPATWAFDHPTVNSMVRELAETTAMRTETLPEPGRAASSVTVSSARCLLPSCPSFLEGEDCMVRMPYARMDLDACFDSEGSQGMSYTMHAACVAGVELFDGERFGIKLPEASMMDPQQRLLLQAASAAGCDQLNRLNDSEAAVVIGQANHDWASEAQSSSPFLGTGVSPAITSNRISFHFCLRGPSMTIDTACSSSLVALAVALSLPGPALMGTTHVMTSTLPFIGCCQAQMLSKRGRCFTFDASADGYSRGEGVGVLRLQSRTAGEGSEGAEMLFASP